MISLTKPYYQPINTWTVIAMFLCAISWWPTLTIILLHVSGSVYWTRGDPWILLIIFSLPLIPSAICFVEGTRNLHLSNLKLEIGNRNGI